METNLSAETKQKLDDMLVYAKEQPLSTRHFLEITSYPLRSVSITFDTVVGKGGHLVWKQEPVEDLFLQEPAIYNNTGYEWFQSFFQNTGQNQTMSKKLWIIQFDNIVKKINEAIEIHHGIFSEKDSDTVSESNKDKFLFHISDVIVMFVHSIGPSQDGNPSWFLKPTDDSELDDLNMVRDEFLPTLSEKELNFLYCNADFLYVIYGYWANYSILPLRLNAPQTTMPCASKLSSEDRFLDHMEGKLSQLKRNQRHLADKRCFMF